MRISTFCAAVLTCVLIGHTPPAAAQVDQQRAQEDFKEAQALCERDGGRLWGVSLCAPLVIADPRTHTLATSQPAPDARWPHGCSDSSTTKWSGSSHELLALVVCQPLSTFACRSAFNFSNSDQQGIGSF